MLFILDLEEAHKALTLRKFMNWPVIQNTYLFVYCILL